MSEAAGFHRLVSEVHMNTSYAHATRTTERGVAVLLIMIGLAVLSLVALLFAFNSATEFQMSNNFVTHEQALQIADAGFNQVKDTLRGADLSIILARTSAVPNYLGDTAPAVGTFAFRNPISFRLARNISFASPPAGVATRTEYGWMTPPAGTPYGAGRYFAKVSDNSDDTSGGASSLFTQLTLDEDYKVFIRVMGVVPNSPGERADANNNTVKNSTAMIEAMIRRDMTFDLRAPFSLYGPDALPSRNSFFDGNSFVIDGFNHNGMSNAQITSNHNHTAPSGDGPGIATFYNNQLGADGVPMATTIRTGTTGQQTDNIEGAPGLFGPEPAIDDITDDIRNAANQDATNIFNPTWMANFINTIKGVADIKYAGDTSLSGSGISLGTVASPKITVVNGDLSIGGGGSGAGILVVTGKLDYSGSFDFEGVVLVIGEGEVDMSGANKALIGGMMVAQLTQVGGNWVYGPPKFTLGGNSNFYYKSDSIRMGMSLMPMQTLSWREITGESDPPTP